MAKCYLAVESGEEIYYQDFKFVSNHQQIWHVSDRSSTNLGQSRESNIDDYFGLAKVSILAAEKVFHPELMQKMLVVKDTHIFNEDVLEVSVMKEDDACEGAGKANIFIASFTTALARLKLCEELQKLGEKVHYYDTDSVIYKWREGQPYIPTGIFLGQMTDELEGDPVVEFGSAGPKSYC
ncbi:unnamed protein product [Porites evermanni]|uniref:DNA-directed DNA polymerase n=1 Tax=Porites evermanni TaxID=104178 RepID=A0ABN8SQR8_9CNID|nr:unnamed protein product [Porites evermanni]